MNQVATTSLALILGIGGAYFLKEYNSEEATPAPKPTPSAVSYTHLRAHET